VTIKLTNDMNSTIELIVELIVGVISLFAAGFALSRVIGSDEYYDKILFDDDDDFITKKNNDVSNDNDDIVHQVSI
jgi:hypothetical protein